VLAGTQLTYTLTVVNHGPATATNVAVADTLPAGVAYLSDTDAAGESRWHADLRPRDLPSGKSTSFRVVVAVDPAFSRRAATP